MNKIALILGIIGLFCVSNVAMADVFDSLENITPAQKQQISNVQNSFKIKNNDLEMRISNYTDKIARIQSDADKTQEQKSLLIGAYERNITTLKNQQNILQKETDAAYKSILTDNQYKQYQAMQLNVNESFNKFLQH